ncbi:hypothetical protein PROFUN_15580 [Planoprotostelium fungivorum]|uniref:Uncharacterized protein n=1 Tax=Planoprotostelium fungivorum TaxID=1890364 RepID=A0A2P6MRK7_9EUKA|nr:hypothetical protein PROFUN_15580 [Planoprotostelium fungivorum]
MDLSCRMFWHSLCLDVETPLRHVDRLKTILVLFFLFSRDIGNKPFVRPAPRVEREKSKDIEDCGKGLTVIDITSAVTSKAWLGYHRNPSKTLSLFEPIWWSAGPPFCLRGRNIASAWEQLIQKLQDKTETQFFMSLQDLSQMYKMGMLGKD